MDLDATVLQNLIHVAPELDDTQARSILGSFLFSGDDALKPARVLSGGEKTRLGVGHAGDEPRERATARRADQQP